MLLQLDLLLGCGDYGGGEVVQAEGTLRHNPGDLPNIDTHNNPERE